MKNWKKTENWEHVSINNGSHQIRLLAELAYVYHGVGQKFEGKMPGLYPFEPKQQPFKLVFPGKSPFHS